MLSKFRYLFLFEAALISGGFSMEALFPNWTAIIWGSISVLAFLAIPVLWAVENRRLPIPGFALPKWMTDTAQMVFVIFLLPWLFFGAMATFFGSIFLIIFVLSGFDYYRAVLNFQYFMSL